MIHQIPESYILYFISHWGKEHINKEYLMPSYYVIIYKTTLISNLGILLDIF